MGFRRRPSGRGHAAAAAAFLALFLQLLFPAGFMVAAPGQAHGLPIVICTAQGQTTVQWDLGGGHKPKAPAKSMPCAFAGHATASAPPLPAAIPASTEAWIAAAAVLPETVAPGRGLAAPPPPAIGPPRLI
jgi:hypothetical protein